MQRREGYKQQWTLVGIGIYECFNIFGDTDLISGHKRFGKR